jgi:hypothetical protein
MAKVLGESGRYVSDAAQKEWRKLILFGFIGIGLLGVGEGFVLSSFLPSVRLPPWAKAILLISAIPAALVLWKWTSRKMDEIGKKRMAFSRGADGENQVARVLSSFPDDFHIIHDLATPFGNVDHVVTGPTGVFLLDTKAWRGVISPDGKGELLINGQPTDKPHVRPFLGRMLDIRDKVRTLAPGLDPFYQAVFVFTSARVEAKWGTTSSVHCVRDEQLYDYIVEKKFGKHLHPEEVQTLAQAFLALAHMDRDFTERSSSRESPPRRPDQTVR